MGHTNIFNFRYIYVSKPNNAISFSATVNASHIYNITLLSKVCNYDFFAFVIMTKGRQIKSTHGSQY